MPEKKRILIIGGVAGGASAAARARRLSEDAEIIMFERGEYISFANCGLPYHISGDIPDRERLLVQTPSSLHKRFRIDVRIRSEVTSIDREKKTVTVRSTDTGKEYEESYDDLVLSPGAEPVRPPIPGVDSSQVFTLRTMNDMDAINTMITDRKPERAIVVGGGYIGLEVTEALHKRGLEVMLVELQPQVMITADPEMAAPIKQQLQLHGIDLRLNTSITSISEDDGVLKATLSTGETVETGFIILSVGVKAEAALAREAGLKVGDRGGIVVDSHMRTSDPHIYAVGDAVEVEDFVGSFKTLIPLAGPANRQGRIAADNIFGRDSEFKKTQGTAICKIFDLAIGMTGLNEKMLKRIDMPHDKVYVHPASHATYYPGASPISLKVLFDPETGRLLGAQALGLVGIDKRIDVLAVGIRTGLTVFDLEHLELSYAPPYGSAKDPINYAGFVASNAFRGDVNLCHFEDVSKPRDDQYLLDVRTDYEAKAGTIPGAHVIPVDELRERLDEIPRNKEILVFCQVGLRGYIACRILSQNGFMCRNLTGGYKTYQAFTDSLPAPKPSERDMHDDTGEELITEVKEPDVIPVSHIDATGLQCPGPIMRLSDTVDALKMGQAVSITVSDPGFATDAPAWCKSTGNRLVNLTSDNGTYTAVVAKGEGIPEVSSCGVSRKKKTIVVFSGDYDRVMAAFIIANGAASMGSDVTLFFTFWGLQALLKTDYKADGKTFKEALFSRMMPRGADDLNLSKMHFGGMGLKMMKDIMKEKNVTPLGDLLTLALKNGIHLVACGMTMDIMGIRSDELIDGVETGGVAMYLSHAEEGNVNLFV